MSDRHSQSSNFRFSLESAREVDSSSMPRVLAVLTVLSAVSIGISLTACSSPPPLKKLAYAELPDQRDFEHEFSTVWHSIEKALRGQKILERDPEEANEVELKRLSKRTIETDWIYAESRDKYQEYQVNGTPRRKPLMIRYKAEVIATRILGGTNVQVKAREEVERLKADGASAGYDTTEPDSSRAAELLEKINLAVLSATP